MFPRCSRQLPEYFTDSDPRIGMNDHLDTPVVQNLLNIGPEIAGDHPVYFQLNQFVHDHSSGAGFEPFSGVFNGFDTTGLVIENEKTVTFPEMTVYGRTGY